MMFVNDLYLSFTVALFFHLSLTQALRMLSHNTTNSSLPTGNTAINETVTTMATSVKNRIDQSKDIIHDAFAQMDRGTFIRGTIVVVGITCLILMYTGIKTFLLRKKRQPKKYTLITDPSTMEEPLFGAHDEEEEEEIEDDTLFVRK